MKFYGLLYLIVTGVGALLSTERTARTSLLLLLLLLESRGPLNFITLWTSFLLRKMNRSLKRTESLEIAGNIIFHSIMLTSLFKLCWRRLTVTELASALQVGTREVTGVGR
jgi:hypothetical protein